MPTIALANLRVREDSRDLVDEVCGQRCRTTYHISDARKIIFFGCRMLVSLDYYSQASHQNLPCKASRFEEVRAYNDVR